MNIPKGQINWIVGNMPVSLSNEEVRNEFLKRMKGKPGFTDKLKEKIIAYAIECHNANQQLCIDFRL